ncbi:competence protein ComC [Haemophilus influenzae]|uniref:competence protein ComC n=1 Tax=Haemophilus influenzae TaxID=727 RepID=UPI003DA9B79E
MWNKGRKNESFFNDPFTPFGKWLSQPFYVHGLTFLLLLSAVIFRPVLDYIEASTRFDETEYELAKKSSELLHQQKILTSLQQQSESRKLSPELAAQIIPLNKQIQRLATRYGLSQHLRWEMGQKPILHLQLTGHFEKTKTFLTALLANTSQLSVSRLQFMKPEDNPLQTEIIFQLDRETK